VNSSTIDAAIIGAGPYGLSLAAHLAATKLSYRIFGTPLSSWRNHMPGGTLLKSDGFASSLYDPGSTFTIADYCREQSLPYSDVGLPVPIETFVAYGLEFQKRFVPQVEETDIVAVERTPGGFQLTTRSGEVVHSKRVVIAAGITHFAYTPPHFADIPKEFVTHSSEHTSAAPFKGRRVAVLGAGASAIDLAGLLDEAGADVHLIARRSAIAFHEPSHEPRPIAQRLLMPRSGRVALAPLHGRAVAVSHLTVQNAQASRPASSRSRPWLVCQAQV
jgi:cation diffusion facilitator CzcD-associated flavoprotein CzcO